MKTSLQPTSRLVIFFACLGWPLMGMAGAPSPWQEIGIAGFLLWCVVAALDALKLYGTNPKFELRLPTKIQGAVDQEIPCDVFLSSDLPQKVILHPGIPIGLNTSVLNGEHQLAPSESAKIKIILQTARRGLYVIEKWYLATPSILGLWRKKFEHHQPMEIWVYPNLLTDRRALAPYLLRKTWEGEHRFRQFGRGREYDRLREYAPGDSLGDIHWKATAKHAKVISKTYQIERNQDVYVIVDASRLSTRQSKSNPQYQRLDHYIDATLWLGRITQSSGDRFGVVTFSDKMHSFIRSATGMTHYQRCRDSLFRLKPRRVSPDFEELIRYLRTQLRQRSLLLFLTSLEDPLQADLFQERIRFLSRHHCVNVMISTEGTVRPLFKPQSAMLEGETPSDRLAGHLLWTRLQELKQSLHRQGVGLDLCDEKNFAPALVARYLELKSREAV